MTRGLIFLGLVLLGSTLAVIYVRHLNRTVFVQQQSVHHQRDELNIEWSKLLLEQATWSVLMIENKARKELQLKIPTLEQTRFIRSGDKQDG